MDDCVVVEGASLDPGAAVSHFPCEETDNDHQLWRFRHLGSGWYQIDAKHSDLCLTVEDSSLDPGARVGQQVCRAIDNDDQLWAVAPAFFGGPDPQLFYNLLVRHSELCLSSEAGAPDPQLRQSPCENGLSADEWFYFDLGELSFLPSDTRLFLGQGRFRVTGAWKDYEGVDGVGTVVPFGAADSGTLWFFDSNNWEMLIKVLDGCDFNGHYWVYLAATTDVEFTVTVTDTETGEVWQRDDVLGQPADAVTDTTAFATCP